MLKSTRKIIREVVMWLRKSLVKTLNSHSRKLNTPNQQRTYSKICQSLEKWKRLKHQVRIVQMAKSKWRISIKNIRKLEVYRSCIKVKNWIQKSILTTIRVCFGKCCSQTGHMKNILNTLTNQNTWSTQLETCTSSNSSL